MNVGQRPGYECEQRVWCEGMSVVGVAVGVHLIQGNPRMGYFRVSWRDLLNLHLDVVLRLVL